MRSGFSAILITAVLSGCVDIGNPFRPPDNGDVAVVGSADRTSVRESESVSLFAAASGGTEPYVYRWSFNGGPDEIEPSESLGEQVAAGPFETAGRYVYRVVATDAEGRTAVDFVAIEVAAAVRVALSVDSDEVFEGSSVGFSTDVTEGLEPFTYAWSMVDGPVDLNLSMETEDVLRTPPLTVEGEYTFEVAVTDAEGFVGRDERVITVNRLFVIDAPSLLIVNEPGTLGVDFEADVEVDTFSWAVVAGTAELDDPLIETPAITALAGETLIVELTVLFVNESQQQAEVIHEAEIVAIENNLPRVLIATNFGAIVFELDADAAPITTANFLLHVDEGFFDGVLFHRNACSDNPDTGECDPFVLQGGGYLREGDELVLKEPPRDPIPSEAGNGLSNGDLYSVAMALSGGNAASAQTQFFINLKDNSFLDNQNFTVFAFVVEGRDVVDAIAEMERTDSPIIPGEVSLPVEDVIMERVTRVAP